MELSLSTTWTLKQAARLARQAGEAVVTPLHLRKALALLAAQKAQRPELRDGVDLAKGKVCEGCGGWHYHWRRHHRECEIRRGLRGTIEAEPLPVTSRREAMDLLDAYRAPIKTTAAI